VILITFTRAGVEEREQMIQANLDAALPNIIYKVTHHPSEQFMAMSTHRRGLAVVIFKNFLQLVLATDAPRAAHIGPSHCDLDWFPYETEHQRIDFQVAADEDMLPGTTQVLADYDPQQELLLHVACKGPGGLVVVRLVGVPYLQ